MALLKHYIIGILLFSLIVIGFFSFYQSGADFYGVEMDGNFTSTYDSINSSIGTTTAIARDMETTIRGESGLLGTAIAIGSTLINVIKMPFQAIDVAMGLMVDINKWVGVPTWMTSIFITILIISLVFMIIYLIAKFRA